MSSTPFGILVVTAALAMTGFGAAAGGLYLLVTGSTSTSWAAVVALVLAPATLYLAYHLFTMTRWAWAALLLLTGLMLLSSVLRLVAAPGLTIAPLAEIVVELALLRYLMLPRLRTRFGVGGAVAEAARIGTEGP